MRNCAIVILLAFLLAACTPNPISPPPTATFISLRVVPTITETPANKSVATPKPTKTPNPGPTRTSVPTYTPATLPEFGSAPYNLREWTVEQADLMIDQISSHLKAIEDAPDYVGVYGYSAYMSQYQYLAFAESEALLRFPDAPQAEIWRWDVCYNSAFSYQSPEAINAPELPCYAKLIEDGLNSSQTNLSELPGWFGAHESRFSFEMASQTPPSGYASSHILTLENNAFLWILEKDGKFQVIGLMSSMFFYRESGARFQLVDLTGDQSPELVLYFGRSHCCGGFTTHFVYDISTGTPKQLTFANLQGTQPHLFSDYDSDITKLDNEAMPSLLFKSHYGNPLDLPCDLRQYEKYSWNNHQFELVETWYDIEKPEEYQDQELCQFAIDTPANQDETNVVVKMIRQVNDSHIPGFQQIIPFRLGEYYAGLGNYEKAYGFFSDVATTPSDEANAEWVKAAQTLLKHYKTANDFYVACSKVPQCDVQNAAQQAIQNIQPALFPTVGETLQTIGVPVKDSGVFDFDADGSAEQWIVVQHPGKSEREFWVLVKNSQKIHALYVTNISSAIPQIDQFEVRFGHPILELKTPTGKVLFSLQKMEFSGQPYILLASPPWNADDEDQAVNQQNDIYSVWDQSVNSLATQLLAGTSPTIIKETLVALKPLKGHDCKTYPYPCDQFYYLLGLTNELAGDKPSAMEVYLQLWKERPTSIYTIMARSKLEPVP